MQFQWFFEWEHAFQNYFPRYTEANLTEYTTRAFFLNNVPWVFRGVDMHMFEESYKFIDDAKTAVAFKPAFGWDTGGGGGGETNNATYVAKQISDLPVGNLHYVYVIQNTPLSDVFDMVSMLASHVELVNFMDLITLAKLRDE